MIIKRIPIPRRTLYFQKYLFNALRCFKNKLYAKLIQVSKFRLSRAFFRNRFIFTADYPNPPQPDRQLEEARKHGETQNEKRYLTLILFINPSMNTHMNK